MLLPSIFGDSLLDDWMDFPRMERPSVEHKLYGTDSARVMKTDVHELDNGYELDVDLPGFKKEDISISLENGYMAISATKAVNNDEKDEKGKLIRKERYSGSMQRSFYIGEDIQEDDIKAKFEDGVLKISVPKEDESKVPEKKTIAIEG